MAEITLTDNKSEIMVGTQDTLAVQALPNHYLQAATRPNTRKAYQADIRHFRDSGGLLPATPDVILRYLHAFAAQLNPRTLTRRLTALKQWHLAQGFVDSTQHLLIRKTLTGIINTHGTPKDKAPALSLEHLTQIVMFLQTRGNLSDARDSALLHIGFFGALRRSELVGIDWEHISFQKEGIEILIPRSKTDPSGEGQTCAIPYGHGVLCPVNALKTWQVLAATTQGPVFRAISRHQTLSDKALSAASINLILKGHAIACQLPDAGRYSGHSLRRGFATSAARQGASLPAILRQGRWRHTDTVLGYIEEGQRFTDNAAVCLLQKQPAED